MREHKHNDPSLFKGCVYLHNLQDASRLPAGGHTLNTNNNKTQRGKKRGSILYIQIHLSKMRVQLSVHCTVNTDSIYPSSIYLSFLLIE